MGMGKRSNTSSFFLLILWKGDSPDYDTRFGFAFKNIESCYQVVSGSRLVFLTTESYCLQELERILYIRCLCVLSLLNFIFQTNGSIQMLHCKCTQWCELIWNNITVVDCDSFRKHLSGFPRSCFWLQFWNIISTHIRDYLEFFSL